MNALETLDLMPLRMELMRICKSMLLIARKPGSKKGYEIYDYENPEYLRLAAQRDAVSAKIREIWNRKMFSRNRELDQMLP